MNGGMVLIGGGQASAVAARTMRRRGYDGPVTIIGDESVLPYQRPPLSKEYLVEGLEDDLWLLTSTWLEDNNVVLRTDSTAVRIDTGTRSVELANGTQVPADRVLIATGGRARCLPAAEGPRIHYLRTKADADRLREHARTATTAIIVGAGFIGAEVASTLRALNVEVTMFCATETPLAEALGERVGRRCAQLHIEHGTKLMVGTPVTSLTEVDGGVEVVSSAGVFRADIAVVGIGIIPNTEIAEASGIKTGNGIWVDKFCRTSVPEIFAAGDVANHEHPLFGTRMRVEHFDNASRQGSVAAKNMLGESTVFDDPHWFWSDQYGMNLQFVGHASALDELVIRGDDTSDSWTAFYLAGPRVRAAFAMNNGEEIALARELISMGIEIDRKTLRDTDIDLMEMFE